jgi:hypothetical protein
MAARDHAEYKGLLDGRNHLLIRVATIMIASFPMTRHLKRRLLSVLGPEVRNPVWHRVIVRMRQLHEGHIRI